MSFWNRKAARVQEMNASGEDAVISHDAMYQYGQTPFPHPGTGNFAYLAKFTNPAFNFYGIDILARGYFRPTQPRPLQANASITQSGIGGLQAGQLVHQPLYDQSISNENTQSV